MLDLRPDQLATVRAILQAEVPECEVWAFGSRAKWTAKDSSDLDLALVASERLPLSKLGRLREAFKDSYLPTKVDVVDVNRVSDEFRRIIESQHVVLQKPGATAAKQNGRAQWQTLPLEECVETIIDYRGKTPTKVSSGIPLITAKVVKNGRIETPDEFIAEADYDGWMRRGIPRAGDVLLTMEAPLGEVAQLDDRKVALAQRLVALRGKPGLLDNWYLKYLLQSVLVQDQLKSRATGTTVLGIKQSELRKINLALPPLAEQRAIAEVLGALDDKIEVNQKINETLEAMAQTIFQSWFVEPAATKLPKGWRKAKISELCDINDWILTKSDKLERVDYVEISEVMRGNIGNVQSYERGKEPGRAKRRLRHGDTVLSTVRPNRGSYFLCLNPSPNLIASTGFAVLTPTKAPWSFIHAAITQPEIFEYLGQHADGGAYPAVRPEIIGAIQVPWPDKSELPERFHSICASLYEQADQNRQESRTLVALRDTLLPKLLSGELRVPESSPAAEAALPPQRKIGKN